MSVVDLSSRISNDWDSCHLNQQSSDSLVYTTDVSAGTNTPTSIELKVGSVCTKPGDSKKYMISKAGLKVRPKQTWVVYTEQKIFVPLNVYGVVTGKGTYIFHGCFISSGKIDPGFCGQLKIGFYNGSNKTITLKTGEKFATAFFMNMETTLDAPLEDPMDEYQNSPNPTYSTIRWWQKFGGWVWEHGIELLTLLIALPASIHWLMEILKK